MESIIDSFKASTDQRRLLESLTNEQFLNLYDQIKKDPELNPKSIYSVIPLSRDRFNLFLSKLTTKRKQLRGQARRNFFGARILLPSETLSSAKASLVQVTEEVVIQQIASEAESKVLNVKFKELSEQHTATVKEFQETKRDKIAHKRKIKQLAASRDVKRQKMAQVTSKYKNLQSQLCKTKRKFTTEKSKLERSAGNQTKKLQNDLNQNRNELSNCRILYGELEKQMEQCKAREISTEERLKELNQSITYLESLLADDQDGNIYVFNSDTNTYTTDLQLCVMKLLGHGVGVHHINNVISEVSHLCGKTVDQLPSVRTINRIGDQRVSVVHAHIADELGEASSTTLMSDETRKRGDSFETFGLQDKTGKQWILGLREMETKSSSNCLKTLKTILGDISDCSTSDAGNKILINIKNTMSDRAATEKSFHKLLQDYREELYPQIYSNWETLTEAEKESLTRMNNFYCGFHILVNFADASESVIKEYEKVVKDCAIGAEAKPETSRFCSSNESGCQRLVRTACKCLARGADEKSGCYGAFRTFVMAEDEEQGHKRTKPRSSLLVPFRGNRFNIVFYNAEIVLFLKDSINNFFSNVLKPNNLLQKAVFYDLQEELYLAETKALGLCSKFLTAPFWRLIESNCSIQEISIAYQKLVDFLESSKTDAADFISGIQTPFPDYVERDEVCERLTQVDSFDHHVVSVLQHIFTSWELLLKKAVGDHLRGGKFCELTDQLIEETESVPKHNKFPERIFAMLDSLMRFRPVATTFCNEAFIMFSLNKTSDWLSSLPDDKRNAILIKAKQEGGELRDSYRRRIHDIDIKLRKKMQDNQEAIQRKQVKDLKVKEDITNEILFYGLWQFPETVKQELSQLSKKKDRINALKAQLRFRKLVLCQQHEDKKIFNFSDKGKDYSDETLSENVTKLIISAMEKESTATLANTKPFLVGKRVEHFFIENDERNSYKGRVISCVPGYREWLNIVYDGDGAVYVYKLLDDYQAGDLTICPEVHV